MTTSSKGAERKKRVVNIFCLLKCGSQQGKSWFMEHTISVCRKSQLNVTGPALVLGQYTGTGPKASLHWMLLGQHCYSTYHICIGCVGPMLEYFCFECNDWTNVKYRICIGREIRLMCLMGSPYVRHFGKNLFMRWACCRSSRSMHGFCWPNNVCWCAESSC